MRCNVLFNIVLLLIFVRFLLTIDAKTSEYY